ISSAGAMLPTPFPYHQRRRMATSPLMVRTELACFPLFASRFPVVGWCGGGKSGFRRIHALLDCLLKTPLPQRSGDVANLFFTAGNPIAIRRIVNSLHHLLEILFDFAAHRFGERCGRDLRRLTHAALP